MILFHTLLNKCSIMKDLQYLSILRKYFRQHKRLPNFEQIKELLGFQSKGSVTYLFRRLVEQGYFVKDRYAFIPQERFFTQRVYDSVKAGFPSPWDEENAHNIDLDTYLIPRPESTIMIKVSGDSMIEAHINTGDMVIVDKGMHPKVDDIVVAEVDREYTLKYLKKDSNGYFLRAWNAKYPDFRAREELKIFGVVTGVVRKYGK